MKSHSVESTLDAAPVYVAVIMGGHPDSVIDSQIAGRPIGPHPCSL
jgi:hypothetical protein